MEQADGLLAYILVNILDVAQFELSHGVAWHVFTMLESKKKKNIHGFTTCLDSL